MRLGRFFSARRRIVPVIAVTVALAIIATSLNGALQSKNDAFAFKTYWPSPSKYIPDNPTPNVYLQINYTGVGERNYTYVISLNSTILAQGEVTVTHRSPFTVYTFSPVPATLQARVTSDGTVVFVQTLNLG